MNLIKNGNFESGTTEPWTTVEGEPLNFDIVPGNNKKWLLTNGFDGPSKGNFRQVVPKIDVLWGIHYRLTFTAKAIPTGGTQQNVAPSDNDVNRLVGELVYYFRLFPELPGILQPGGEALISVVETTYSHRFTLKHFSPITHGQLTIVNWGGGISDKANILITDIKLEVDNSPIDPEDPVGNERTIDLSSIGLPVITASPMKEVK